MITLRASQANRWINCPAATALSASMTGVAVDSTDIMGYADEGTLAHRLVALELEATFLGLPRQDYEKELQDIQSHPKYSTDMLDFMVSYVDKIREVSIEMQAKQSHYSLLVEHTMSQVINGVEVSGTADAIVYGDGALHIVDYKYGMGVEVTAVENKQLLTYALLYKLETGVEVNRVVLHIVQPRLNNFSVYELTGEELTEHFTEVLEAIDAATEPVAPKVGSWCKFCAAKPLCPARKELFDEWNDLGTLPKLLTDAELESALRYSDYVIEWLKAVQDFAFQRAMAGKRWRGFKLVAKRRSRRIEDPEAAVATLIKAGYEPSAYLQSTLLPITKLEKSLGREVMNSLIGEFISLSAESYKLVSRDNREPEAELWGNGSEFE